MYFILILALFGNDNKRGLLPRRKQVSSIARFINHRRTVLNLLLQLKRFEMILLGRCFRSVSSHQKMLGKKTSDHDVIEGTDFCRIQDQLGTLVDTVNLGSDGYTYSECSLEIAKISLK